LRDDAVGQRAAAADLRARQTGALPGDGRPRLRFLLRCVRLKTLLVDGAEARGSLVLAPLAGHGPAEHLGHDRRRRLADRPAAPGLALRADAIARSAGRALQRRAVALQ